MYPNPVDLDLTVQSTEEIYELRIFDVLGNEVYRDINHNQGQQLRISTADFGAGIYFIQLKIGSGLATQRFVKL